MHPGQAGDRAALCDSEPGEREREPAVCVREGVLEAGGGGGEHAAVREAAGV